MALARIPLAAAGEVDPALVARAAEAIRKGMLVVLPTETVYGLAADPGVPGSSERLAGWKGRQASKPLTHHLASRAGWDGLAQPASPRIERLLTRYWPGPLTVVAAARGGGSIGMRVPAHAFTRAVIAAVGGDLLMTSVNRANEPPSIDPAEIASRFGAELDLLFDSGKSRLGLASTIVDVQRDTFEVLREGILTRDEVLTTAARTVLFVCSGNTCRSPMAEAIAQQVAAERLGVPKERLLARGLRVLSAGVSTLPGMPASETAEAAMREQGISLAGHRSRSLTRDLAREASLILVMTGSHRERLIELDPSLKKKVSLLDADGQDVQDPFGGDLSQYRRTRDDLQARIESRWQDLARLLAT